MSERQTPYDDVFRTLATKRSDMLIAIVNEMFGLDYPPDTPVSLKNDIHLFGGQRIETDSLFQIGYHMFHIECQSNVDNTISVRIIEYDFIAVLETAQKNEDGVYDLKFPRSGILMLRHNSNTKDQEIVRLHFPDDSIKEISFRVMKAQSYTIDEIFKKKLYFLVPFYIMRFEKLKKPNGFSEALKQRMIEEITEILNRLHDICTKEDKIDIYLDIHEMVKKISEFMFSNTIVEKEVTDMIERTLYELPSDKIKKAEAEGEAKGERKAIINLVKKGLLPVAQGAAELGITVKTLNTML